MEPRRLPLIKAFDTPFISLDETSVEMTSILFLFLAVIFISQVKQHRQLVRRIVQLVSLVVFFFVVYSCLGVFGMIRNSLYGMSLIGSVYTESFYWMALPVVIVSVTLITGPTFCGWICPTGTIQELAAALKKKFVKGDKPRTRTQLALLGVVLAGLLALTWWISREKRMFVEDSSLHWASALVLLCYLVLLGVADDLPTRRLRLFSVFAIVLTAVSHVTITSPVHFAFTSRDDPASATTTLIIAGASMVVARSWCRYLCPWGYIMGFLHRFSRLKILRIDELCNHCDKCVHACDVGAIDAQGIRTEHCQFCYVCVDICPTSAFEVVDVLKPKPAPRTSRLPVLPSDTSSR